MTRQQKRALRKQQGLNNPAEQQVAGGVTAIGWSFRSGPLPSAKELAEYEQVVPGSGQLIVQKFAQQSDHRRELEAVVVKGNDRRANRGQWMAWSLSAMALLGGTYLIATGKPTAGLVAIIGAISGLVIVFVTGKVAQAAERKEKRQGR